MKAIVAVDQNWAIGNQGNLLVHISPDLKNFRAKTKGKVVIYGRKTLETFPNAKPLPYRSNIILSRNTGLNVEEAITVHSIDELKHVMETECAGYNTDDFIVIGGDSIYRQLLPMCNEALVTKIEQTFEADAWFPNLDDDPEWYCAEQGELQEWEGIPFHFDVYRRKEKQES